MDMEQFYSPKLAFLKPNLKVLMDIGWHESEDRSEDFLKNCYLSILCNLKERKSKSWQKPYTDLFHFESSLILTIRKGYKHMDLLYIFGTKDTA